MIDLLAICICINMKMFICSRQYYISIYTQPSSPASPKNNQSVLQTNYPVTEKMAAFDENSSSSDGIPEFTPFEHILSVTWESGSLSAAFYTIQTMETFVVQEVIDLRPNFSLFHNLFRQLNPVYVLASGHESFLRQVMQLLNIPADADLTLFNVRKASFVANSKFYVYQRGTNSLQLNRQRILKIKLSGMDPNLTDQQRQLYVDSILPMKQNTVVQSLGNLLDFLDTNIKVLFRFDAAQRNVIADLRVYSLNDQLQMDDTTFEALKIFSTKRHPSAFKQEVNNRHRDGFSIFTLLNRCSSKIGAVELKTVMQQPIKDMKELNLRYDSVEWFQRLENSSTCSILQRHLRNVSDIRTTYKRLLEDPVGLPVWRTFQKSVINSYRVLEVVKGAVAQGENTGLLKCSAEAIKDRSNLELVIQSLDTILDLRVEDNNTTFIIRSEVDPDLDQKKETFTELQNNLPETFIEEIQQFTGGDENISYNVTFIPEMGYVLAIVVHVDLGAEQLAPERIFKSREDFHLELCSGNCFYYMTPYCAILNEQFGELYNEIRELEDKIIQNLFRFIESVMVDIQAVVRLCAQVDYLMAFGMVSQRNHYVRPVLSTEKVLDIKNGRHVLLEVQCDFVGNDVCIETERLVHLLTAPNSTGKSVFLKQIGSIAYLAHIGCFVPATHATIGLLDAIYSRIYSPEAMHQEISSFLADVQQMGKLIMNSTDRSLLLVDEFGKGSNVDEGKAILVACLEELIERGRATPITFLTTHYLDVFELIDEKLRESGTICLTIPTSVAEDGSLVSTFRVTPGRCPERYAFQHSELRKTIQQSSEGTVNNTSFCTLNESSMEFEDEVTKRKISFAYHLYQEYLNKGTVEFADVLDRFNELSLPVDANITEDNNTVVAPNNSGCDDASVDEEELFAELTGLPDYLK